MILCFSHLRWDFVYQRPQHLLSRAVLDQPVLFFEEPVHDGTQVDSLALRTSPEGVTIAVPHLRRDLGFDAAAKAQRRLLDDLLDRMKPQSLRTWYYSAEALSFSDHLKPEVCIYDNMDELSAFLGASPRLIDLETKLLSKADVVFTGGMSLYEAKRHRHPNIHAFPSSVDVRHFAASRRLAANTPDRIASREPRIGFFGVIDERLDLELVAALAALRPSWQFFMIGPVVKIDPASLPQAANIHWLGARPYSALPECLADWDVGFMPFARNASTQFISPTKTPEFLAAGLPVVSTAIADVVRPYGERGLVEIAADAPAFADRIAALLVRPRREWMSRVDAHLATMSWDITWSAMKEHIEAAAARTHTAPVRPATELARV